MLTRRQVRGVLLWLGIACGGAGALLFVFSFFGQLAYSGPLREVTLGRGALYLVWHRTARTVPGTAVARVVPRGGAASAPAATTAGPAAPSPTPVTVVTSPALSETEVEAMRQLELRAAELSRAASQLPARRAQVAAAAPGAAVGTTVDLAEARAQLRIMTTETAQLAAANRALAARSLALNRLVPAPRVQRPREFTFAAIPTDRGWHWMPRFVTPDDVGNPGRLALPFWVLLLIGAWCLYRKLPGDVAPGICPGCRFDLRGVPTLQGHPGLARCPECGRVSEAPAVRTNPAEATTPA